MSSERKPPRLIPVLDVMNGRVVRAVGGRRDEYRPIKCTLSDSSVPAEVADGLAYLSGTLEHYVADLDAIRGGGIARAVRLLFEERSAPMWLDAGIGSRVRVRDLPNLPHLRPVVGSETCDSPDLLRDALAEAGDRPLAFSIDMKADRLMGSWRNWQLNGEQDALRLARRVVEMGVGTLIVLDLARVGTGTGTGTEPLLRAIRAEFPNVDLIAGGGVRTWADVSRLGEAGVTGVLVASALHDRTLKMPRKAQQ